MDQQNTEAIPDSIAREAQADEALQFKDAQIAYLTNRVVGLNARIRVAEEKNRLLERKVALLESANEGDSVDPPETE